MPKFHKSTIDSPARVRLAEAIKAQKAEADRAAAALEAARAALGRLQATDIAADPIRQQIAALDASETKEALAAARGGTATPEPDTKRRADLQRELSAALAREEASRRAMPEIEAEIARESQGRPEFEQAKSAAITEILNEEIEHLIEDLAEAVATAWRKEQALSEIRGAILRETDASADRNAYIRLEALDGKLASARQRPIVDTAAERAAWMAFASELRQNAGAVLAKVSAEHHVPMPIAEIARRRELALNQREVA